MNNSNQTNTNDNDESYISFARIFKYIKKCAPMMFVSCLILVVCAVLVVGAYSSIKGDNLSYAEGIVELSFDGIEDGRDPYGNVFDSQTIKSSTSISTVVQKLKYSYSVQNIRDAITIEGFLNKETIAKIQAIKDAAKNNSALLAELDTIKQHPTKFIVRLNYKEAKVKKSDAVRIVDELMLEYGNYFKKAYQKGSYFSDKVFMDNIALLDNKKLDYIEVYDNLYHETAIIARYLDSMAAKNPDFRSSISNLKFQDLRSELSAIESILANYKSVVVANGITKDLSSVRAYLSNKENALSSSKTTIKANIEDIKLILEKYKPITIVVGGDGKIPDLSAQSRAYDEMYNKLIALTADLAETERSLLDIQYRQAQYDKAATLDPKALAAVTQTATDKLTIVKDSMIDLIGKINDTVVDYTQTKVIDKAVNVSVVASTGKEKETNTRLMLYAVIAAIFVGIIAGMPLTKVVNKMLAKKAAAKLATVEVAATPIAPQEQAAPAATVAETAEEEPTNTQTK